MAGRVAAHDPTLSVRRPVAQPRQRLFFMLHVFPLPYERVITVVTEFISPHIHDANNNVLVLVFVFSKTGT